MRLGYFGGSFDPPHRAHLRVALLARQQFGLERVLLAPTGRQPLKAAGAEVSFADRLRMVELLCTGEPGLQASAVDGPQPHGQPNYTVDTLRRLHASPEVSGPEPTGTELTGTEPQSPAAMEIFFIVGADAFLGLRQWREPEALLHLAQWVVVSRPGFALNAGSLDRGLPGLSAMQRRRIHLLPGLQEAVSATELRDRLHRGLDCRELIPPPVLAYIESHRLYRR